MRLVFSWNPCSDIGSSVFWQTTQHNDNDSYLAGLYRSADPSVENIVIISPQQRQVTGTQKW